MEEKLELLQAMHIIIMKLNDESGYDKWFKYLDRYNDDEDFEKYCVGSANDTFHEICNVFEEIMNESLKEGFVLSDASEIY